MCLVLGIHNFQSMQSILMVAKRTTTSSFASCHNLQMCHPPAPLQAVGEDTQRAHMCLCGLSGSIALVSVGDVGRHTADSENTSSCWCRYSEVVANLRPLPLCRTFFWQGSHVPFLSPHPHVSLKLHPHLIMFITRRQSQVNSILSLDLCPIRTLEGVWSSGVMNQGNSQLSELSTMWLCWNTSTICSMVLALHSINAEMSFKRLNFQ